MKRTTIRTLLAATTAALAVLASPMAAAQAFPNKPVKMVVPYPAGGGVDVMARAVAQKLQDKWQQPVTVDNRPGANTLLGTEAVARASMEIDRLLASLK